MTIDCRHCGGESSVVLTRRIATRNGSGVNHNIMRTRQCDECRFKWKTVEKGYAEKIFKKNRTDPQRGLSLPQVRQSQPRAENDSG